MRISDWSSDVCSSDLFALRLTLRLEVWYEPAEVDIGSVESLGQGFVAARRREHKIPMRSVVGIAISENEREAAIGDRKSDGLDFDRVWVAAVQAPSQFHLPAFDKHLVEGFGHRVNRPGGNIRSEEHTSELQSLMRISYAVFCLK